jgi:hypothetical protein
MPTTPSGWQLAGGLSDFREVRKTPVELLAPGGGRLSKRTSLYFEPVKSRHRRAAAIVQRIAEQLTAGDRRDAPLVEAHWLPNVGKSSCSTRWPKDTSPVANEPGTTRDISHARLTWRASAASFPTRLASSPRSQRAAISTRLI